MKRIPACILTFFIAVLACLLPVSARYTPNLTGTPGQFVTDADAHSSVGHVVITWDAHASEKIDTCDGTTDDWQGYVYTDIHADHMVSWMQNGDYTSWQGQVSFVADAEFLYIRVYVEDDDLCAVDPSHPYDYRKGETIQLNLDFGCKLSQLIAQDPAIVDTLPVTTNVVYSFGYNGDGGAIAVQVQNTDHEHTCLGPDDGVIGTTIREGNGFAAEFTLPWQRLYEDHALKPWIAETGPDSAIYIGGEDSIPLSIGATLYYIDQTPSGNVAWAAGTHSGFAGTDAEGNLLDAGSNPPLLRWDVYDNGMKLILEPARDMHFACPYIVILPGGVFPETDPPIIPPTTRPTDQTDIPVVPVPPDSGFDSSPESTRPPDDNVDTEIGILDTSATTSPVGTVTDRLTEDGRTYTDAVVLIEKPSGCASAVVGSGMMALLMILPAAGLCLRKRMNDQ